MMSERSSGADRPNPVHRLEDLRLCPKGGGTL